MGQAAPFETALLTLWQKLKLVPNAKRDVYIDGYIGRERERDVYIDRYIGKERERDVYIYIYTGRKRDVYI